MAAIWRELLGIDRVGVEDDFFEVGGQSLLVVRLLARLREAFGCEVPLLDLYAAPTVAGLALRIEAARCRHLPALRHLRGEAAQVTPGSPLVEIRNLPSIPPYDKGGRPRPSQPPFFCVHPAGGTVLCYADLARHLELPGTFYGIQAPGLVTGQVPLASMEEQARCYVDAIRQLHPAGPYHLGGWSMGGIVAYEMARQLCDAGQEIGLLALLDAGPIPPSRTPEDEAGFSQAIGQLADLHRFAEQIETSEQAAHLWQKLRDLRLLPPDVELPEDVEPDDMCAVRLFVANILALWRYRPDPYAGPVTLFLAEEKRPWREHVPADRRWAEVGVEVERVPVPGNHLTLMAEPHVRVLAERLRPLLVG